MANERFTDPLSIDVSDDLKRVDEVMTHILKDRSIWSEFFRDPNGVLIRLGLHPPTSAEINERANRMFYATMTNEKLIQLLAKHYETFRPSKPEEYIEYNEAGLRKGVIQNHIELDLEAFHHILEQPDVLRESLKLSLHDLNEKRILQTKHTREEIDAYIERLIEAVRHRLPIADLPKLEIWDRNYGLGLKYGSPFAELPAVVTIATEIEVVLGATAAVIVYNVTELWGPAPTSLTARLPDAAAGNEDSIRAVAILSRMLDFSAELLVYVQNFERGTRT